VSSIVCASAPSTVFRAANVRPGLHPVVDINPLDVPLNGVRMHFGKEILDPASVCNEAFEESDDNCVLKQLCTVSDRRGHLWTEAMLTRDFDEAWAALLLERPRTICLG
jgi:hypothetical protein